jgi:predicted ribosome quality control (RQC) complex YloA/Tae2 family protein
MNNFYTLRALSAELNYEIIGKKVVQARTFRKNQLEIEFSPDPPGVLVFHASSPGTALFLDRKPGKPSRNSAVLFHEIAGMTVTGLYLASDEDRLVRMSFDEPGLSMLFMPFGSRPNAFLIRDGKIISAFKDASGYIGKKSPEPKSLPASAGEDETGLPADKRILAFDPRFPRHLLNDVILSFGLESASSDEFLKAMSEVRDILRSPEGACITADGHLSLLPPDFLHQPPERGFGQVNEAVRTLFIGHSREKRLSPGKNDLIKKLRRRLDKMKKQHIMLPDPSELSRKAEKMEHFGHLLMSYPRPKEIPGGEQVRVTDWAAGGEEVDVPVKQGRTVLEQARKYYDKAAGVAKELDMLDTNRQRIERQIREIEGLLAELEALLQPAELEKWTVRYKDRLQQWNITPGNQPQETRPYRIIPLENIEVWIGKNARGNDEILARSHKEDIWMHARGTAGSHLVVRNRGAAGWPDKHLLLKAASWAAYYSRQSGASLVPVMIAKRKHIRKPKGAEPGQVVVAREKVEMVVPEKPNVPDS